MKVTPWFRSANPFFRALLAALPGILLWWCFVGYVLGGLSWPAPLLLAVLAAGSLLAGALSVRWLAQLNLSEFIRPLASSVAPTILLASFFLLALIGLASFLPPLTYPANHSLTVCAPETYDRANNPFVIHAIEYQDGPPFPLLDLKGNEPWNLLSEGLVALTGGACAHYGGFFEGGLVLLLREGPGAGSAMIEWDGRSQSVSLEASNEGIRRTELSGDHPASTTPLRSTLATVFRLTLAVTLLGAALGLALAFRAGRWGVGALLGDNVWLALGLLALVGLLATADLGRSTALMGDDFCYSAVAAQSGVLDGTRNFYANINGRLLGNFVGVLSGRMFPLVQPPYIIVIILALFVVSLVPLLTRLLAWLTGKPLTSTAWVLSAVIVLVTLINTPDIYQSLFWRSGRQPLLYPLMLLPAILALLSDLAGLKRKGSAWGRLFLVFFLTLCAAAFHEVFAAAQVAFLASSLVVLLLYGRQAKRTVPLLMQGLLTAIAGAVAGLLIHILSPGTAERSSVLGSNFDLPRILYGTLYDSNLFLFAGNLNILTIGLFLLGAILVIRSSRLSRFGKKQGLLIWLGFPLVMYVAVLAAFAVGHYGISQTMPERTQIIPTFLAILGALIWGMLSGVEFLRWGPKVSKRTLQVVQVMALFIFGVAFVFHGYVMISRQESFEHYQRAVNVMVSSIDEARKAGAGHVVISQLPDNLSDVVSPGANQRNFVNACLDQLFGVEVAFD